MNKNRKWLYVAVLGVGGAVLTFDVITGGGGSPASAEASHASAVMPAISAPAPAESTRPTLTSNARSEVAAVLRDYEQAQPIVFDRVGDLFAPNPGWAAQPTTQPHTDHATPKQHDLPAVTLGGIVVSGKDRFAIINGETAVIGHEIEGWTLIKIDPTRVVFVREGQSHAVSMPRPGQ